MGIDSMYRWRGSNLQKLRKTPLAVCRNSTFSFADRTLVEFVKSVLINVRHTLLISIFCPFLKDLDSVSYVTHFVVFESFKEPLNIRPIFGRSNIVKDGG